MEIIEQVVDIFSVYINKRQSTGGGMEKDLLGNSTARGDLPSCLEKHTHLW